jgi:hypothetical protein
MAEKEGDGEGTGWAPIMQIHSVTFIAEVTGYWLRRGR